MLSKWRHYVWCISLLLCAATVVLWVRSYWVWDSVYRLNVVGKQGSRTRFERSSLVQSVRGRVRVDDEVEYRDYRGGFAGFAFSGFEIPAGLRYQYGREPAPPAIGNPDLAHVNLYGYAKMIRQGEYHVAGISLVYRFQQEDPPREFRSRAIVVQIPWPVIAFLMALPPALWGYRYARRQTRQTQGACKRCGYDLRATPDRCPECGHVPENVTA